MLNYSSFTSRKTLLCTSQSRKLQHVHGLIDSNCMWSSLPEFFSVVPYRWAFYRRLIWLKEIGTRETSQNFQSSWDLEFFIIPKSNDAMCVICHKLIAGFREYNIKYHYETIHRDKIEKYCELEWRVQEARFEERKKVIDYTEKPLLLLLTQASLLPKFIGKHQRPFGDDEYIKVAALATQFRLFRFIMQRRGHSTV